MRKNLFWWLMEPGWHKRHGIHNESGTRNSRRGRDCEEGKISPGVVGGKAAIRRATGWHALRWNEKKGCQRGRGQVLQARYYVYHTKRPRDALTCRQTGPDVSCWELVGFTSGDKNRLPGLAFSFNRGVKRPARSRPRYWTFRDRLRAGSLRAEIQCTMRVATLVCHLVNLFFTACSPQLGCRWPFTVRKDGRSGTRKGKFLWLFLRPLFVTLTRQLGRFRSNQSTQWCPPMIVRKSLSSHQRCIDHSACANYSSVDILCRESALSHIRFIKIELYICQ